MKHLVFLMMVALSFPVVAQDKKTEQKKSAKKKAEPKASKQDWGNWSKSGDKTLDDKAKKDAAKKKK
jgi:hypothetical protein